MYPHLSFHRTRYDSCLFHVYGSRAELIADGHALNGSALSPYSAMYSDAASMQRLETILQNAECRAWVSSAELTRQVQENQRVFRMLAEKVEARLGQGTHQLFAWQQEILTKLDCAVMARQTEHSEQMNQLQEFWKS